MRPPVPRCDLRSTSERRVDPAAHVPTVPRIRPIVDGGESPAETRIVGQPWWQQRRPVRRPPEVGVTRQQNADQSAPRVFPRVAQTRTDLPVHVSPLPRTPTHQHHGHGRARDEIVPDPASHRVHLHAGVDVAITHRPIYEAVAKPPAERIPVVPVQFVMEAHEHLVPVRHALIPAAQRLRLGQGRLPTFSHRILPRSPTGRWTAPTRPPPSSFPACSTPPPLMANRPPG